MRLTTSQLRRLVISPRQFVASALALPSVTQQYGNPQRQWMEAAWRAYFRSHRDPKQLWDAFYEKAVTAGGTPRRQALASGAEPMLDVFLRWDAKEPTSPADWFPPTRDVPWQGHVLAVKRDLLYVAKEGHRVRQLWSDTALRATHRDAGIMAAAALICAESDLGLGRIKTIDVWQLRHQDQRSWTRDSLLEDVDRLHDLLDRVAAELP